MSQFPGPADKQLPAKVMRTEKRVLITEHKIEAASASITTFSYVDPAVGSFITTDSALGDTGLDVQLAVGDSDLESGIGKLYAVKGWISYTCDDAVLISMMSPDSEDSGYCGFTVTGQTGVLELGVTTSVPSATSGKWFAIEGVASLIPADSTSPFTTLTLNAAIITGGDTLTILPGSYLSVTPLDKGF
jgi:hypothetical protein